MRRFLSLAVVALGLSSATVVAGGEALPSYASIAPETGALVSNVPAAFTPDVLGSGYKVSAVTAVGTKEVIGGDFTGGIAPAGGSYSVQQNYIFAIDAASGAISTTFRPSLNGAVQALRVGPTVGSDPTVYVGGEFKRIDGTTDPYLALLDLNTGKLVRGFKAPTLNGAVNAIALRHSQLIVGGDFTTAGGKTADGIASLDPASGALTSYISFGVRGHHNWYRGCTSRQGAPCHEGEVGVKKLSVSPSGTRMVMIGNFTRAGGLARDQVAMVDLSRTAAKVDPDWATKLYTAKCYYWDFDSYVRSVAFSPDGSYFVIAATGGGGFPKPDSEGCDSAARFETASTGSSVSPRWVDYSGNDTVDAVAISNSAVYVGGHFRWLNNSNGSDYAAAGAVPRPGLAALDPVNGIPFSWDPGRQPRGIGVFAMSLTSAGLWIGSNTDYIGNRKYYRAKLAFFPTGGEILPGAAVPGLGNVYLGSSSGLADRQFNGSRVGSTTKVAVDPSVDWSIVHGGFMVNNDLYFLCAPANGAACDGNGDRGLFEVPFNGSSFGSVQWVEPFNDPSWEDVSTGSGGKTPDYVGVPAPLYAKASKVTGLCYRGGELYYTMSGSSQLYESAFEPENGIVGAQQPTTPFVVPSSISLSGTKGLFTSGGELYYVGSGGSLHKVSFNDKAITGRSTLVDSKNSWTARALFLGPS